MYARAGIGFADDRRVLSVKSRAACLFLLVALGEGCAGRIHPAPSPVNAVPMPSAVSSPMGFLATAYCTGTITASGTAVAEGVAAADPTLLPIGTVIRVTGAAKPYDNRVYTVMDTGPKIRGRRLDLYIARCAEAIRFGRQSVRVTVLRSVDP